MRDFCATKRWRTPVWLIVRVCLGLVVQASFGPAAQSAFAGIEPDFLMDSDPELPLPEPVLEVDPNLSALWMQALNRPEIDMQRMAAETIARAHERGIPDLDKAVPRLEEILSADQSHPAARFAAARALISLESRRSSDQLFEASQRYGSDLRQLIEPALATWNHASAINVWVERLRSAETRPRELILAIRGLGEVGEQSALTDLLSIVSDPTRNAGVRLEAAVAAGQIAETNLEPHAQRLAENDGAPLFVNQLCAIRLLARHSSEVARGLLIELAGHEEPAVAAAAMQRLNEIDSSLVVPLAETALQSSDPEVRRQGVVSLRPNPAIRYVDPLSQLLADPHPEVRQFVCECLFEWCDISDPGMNEAIRDAAMNVLEGDRWQGQEQAALLLGALEHEPAADRLIELLESPREEVRVPAAWGLRKVANPETVPALIEHATRLTEFRQSHELPGLDEQVAHLFEALGVLQAKDATPLLMKYVPKHVSRNNLSRGAAIWALGRIYAGTGDSEIEAALAERILDFAPKPYEVLLVKQMSAIALGRMQAVDHASMMRQYATDTELGQSGSANDAIRLRLALRWAVKQLTGEELPPPEPLRVDPGSWFLEPLH